MRWVLVLLAAAVLVGCGSTQTIEDAPRYTEEAFTINLFPPCPSLEGLDGPQVVELVKAWLSTVENLGPNMPANIHIVIEDVLNQKLQGEVSPDVQQDITSTIEAVIEGLKQP